MPLRQIEAINVDLAVNIQDVDLLLEKLVYYSQGVLPFPQHSILNLSQI